MEKQRVWKKFLCLFAQEHPDFRTQELQSLASSACSEVRFDQSSYSNKNPHLIIELESDAIAKQILSRSVLIKSILELWGWGQDYFALKSSIQSSMPEELMEPYACDDYTFRMVASGFSRKCSSKRQKMIFEKTAFLPLNGKVDLKNPQHIFYVLEDYGDCPNTAPQEPQRIFFGRLIGQGQRDLNHHYSVKTRHFIGNTSMDAQLSFIMANQAKVTSGDLILDPFAGTGSVLVACAHFGGYVVGADIDWRIVHGKGCTSRAGSASKQRGQDENVRANLRQYGLESRYLDMVVADAAKSVWARDGLFDAIVTDPPYGIREGSRKIGSKSEEPKVIPPGCVDDHIPEVKNYKLSELVVDLIEFAARFLVLGGRLVYWIPVIRTELALLPSHPCLRQVSCSLQPLQRHVGRELITMEKCVSWEEYTRLHSRQVETVASAVKDTEEEEEEKGRSLLKLKLQDNFREKYFDENWHK